MNAPLSVPRYVSVAYEQAVYGSFPFWDQGYAILAQSPGCRSEWLADFRAACQRYGERPPGAAESSALFCLKLASGPWAIVGVFPQGRDDAGRPGALAFHGLFLKGSDYRRAGATPFAFRSALHDHWTAEIRELPQGRHFVPFLRSAESDIECSHNREAQVIARAIARGRRVRVESPAPIDLLAQRVWTLLPPKVKGRASLATWTFSIANGHDLAALPRVHPNLLEPLGVDLATLLAEAPIDDQLNASFAYPLVQRLFWSGLALVGLTVLILTWLKRVG